MVRDAIVFWTKDHKVREKCINEGSDLTLEKVTSFARTLELSQEQLKSMSLEDQSVNVVNKRQNSHKVPSGGASGTTTKKEKKETPEITQNDQ